MYVDEYNVLNKKKISKLGKMFWRRRLAKDKYVSVKSNCYKPTNYSFFRIPITFETRLNIININEC